MLRRNRGFLTFIATVAVLGVGLRLIWDTATDQTDPPIWLSILAAVGVVAVAMAVESWDDRRRAHKARAHVEGPRPTNSDGTPFGYHQIRAGGWEHCDGCGLWGQGWTPEKPHNCQQTHAHRPTANRKDSR